MHCSELEPEEAAAAEEVLLAAATTSVTKEHRACCSVDNVGGVCLSASLMDTCTADASIIFITGGDAGGAGH